MNKLTSYLFILLMLALVNSVNAQDTTRAANCFEQYRDLFQKKGTYEVKDGIHQIVITIRQGSTCQVLEGRLFVDRGKLTGPTYIKDSTGQYVKPTKKLSSKYEAYRIPLEFNIVNGMSASTYITEENDLVDIFLIDVLKP